jgi:uracil-DNA glycosylase
MNCRKCSNDNHAGEINGFKKPCCWWKKDEIKVIVLGHSPYVRSSEKAKYVLNMDKPKGHLYKYIKKEILNPLDIDFDKIYCTNLLKCLTYKPPEDISPKNIFFDMLNNCKKLFEEEVSIISPKIIIGLSECVLKFISKNYYQKELSMKESFGRLLKINIEGIDYNFIPVVHLTRKKSFADNYYFPTQTNRLREILFNSELN